MMMTAESSGITDEEDVDGTVPLSSDRNVKFGYAY
jgi:hypothetical protein